ncbi:hypothetical protein LzC2_15090 [Planctomycetes bacterium LzC2]|uniref:Tetratricopeptide repeat protein n=1 Tax=Alienimonas chondri TaxID=2681879 RepID=A0ABX1VBK4_9PLAN|nr:hypothetical protein [Alienimonas chondri]
MGGWAAWEHRLAAPAAPHRELNTVDDDADKWPEAAVEYEVDRLSEAIERRPDDVEARFTLARLLMRRYRDETLEALRAEPATAGMSEQALERIADPGFGAFAAIGPDQTARLSAIRADPRVQRSLAPAFEQLSAARADCPFLPRLDYHLARIAWAAPGEDPTGRRFLSALHRNFPADVDVQAAAADRAERLGLHEIADECWRSVLALDADRAAVVASTLSTGKIPDVAERARFLTLLPSSPAAHSAAAEAVATKFPTLAVELAEKTLAGDAAPRDRAFALRLTNDSAGAVEAMRSHLAAAPRDVAARRTFIGWLLEDERLDAASEQLAILSAVAPDDPLTDRLLDRLAQARRSASTDGVR